MVSNVPDDLPLNKHRSIKQRVTDLLKLKKKKSHVTFSNDLVDVLYFETDSDATTEGEEEEEVIFTIPLISRMEFGTSTDTDMHKLLVSPCCQETSTTSTPLSEYAVDSPAGCEFSVHEIINDAAMVESSVDESIASDVTVDEDRSYPAHLDYLSERDVDLHSCTSDANSSDHGSDQVTELCPEEDIDPDNRLDDVKPSSGEELVRDPKYLSPNPLIEAFLTAKSYEDDEELVETTSDYDADDEDIVKEPTVADKPTVVVDTSTEADEEPATNEVMNEPIECDTTAELCPVTDEGIDHEPTATDEIMYNNDSPKSTETESSTMTGEGRRSTVGGELVMYHEEEDRYNEITAADELAGADIVSELAASSCDVMVTDIVSMTNQDITIDVSTVTNVSAEEPIVEDFAVADSPADVATEVAVSDTTTVLDKITVSEVSISTDVLIEVSPLNMNDVSMLNDAQLIDLGESSGVHQQHLSSDNSSSLIFESANSDNVVSLSDDLICVTPDITDSSPLSLTPTSLLSSVPQTQSVLEVELESSPAPQTNRPWSSLSLTPTSLLSAVPQTQSVLEVELESSPAPQTIITISDDLLVAPEESIENDMPDIVKDAVSSTHATYSSANPPPCVTGSGSEGKYSATGSSYIDESEPQLIEESIVKDAVSSTHATYSWTDPSPSSTCSSRLSSLKRSNLSSDFSTTSPSSAVSTPSVKPPHGKKKATPIFKMIRKIFKIKSKDGSKATQTADIVVTDKQIQASTSSKGSKSDEEIIERNDNLKRILQGHLEHSCSSHKTSSIEEEVLPTVIAESIGSSHSEDDFYKLIIQHAEDESKSDEEMIYNNEEENKENQKETEEALTDVNDSPSSNNQSTLSLIDSLDLAFTSFVPVESESSKESPLLIDDLWDNTEINNTIENVSGCSGSDGKYSATGSASEGKYSATGSSYIDESEPQFIEESIEPEVSTRQRHPSDNTVFKIASSSVRAELFDDFYDPIDSASIPSYSSEIESEVKNDEDQRSDIEIHGSDTDVEEYLVEETLGNTSSTDQLMSPEKIELFIKECSPTASESNESFITFTSQTPLSEVSTASVHVIELCDSLENKVNQLVEEDDSVQLENNGLVVNASEDEEENVIVEAIEINEVAQAIEESDSIYTSDDTGHGSPDSIERIMQEYVTFFGEVDEDNNIASNSSISTSSSGFESEVTSMSDETREDILLLVIAYEEGSQYTEDTNPSISSEEETLHHEASNTPEDIPEDSSTLLIEVSDLHDTNCMPDNMLESQDPILVEMTEQHEVCSAMSIESIECISAEMLGNVAIEQLETTSSSNDPDMFSIYTESPITPSPPPLFEYGYQITEFQTPGYTSEDEFDTKLAELVENLVDDVFRSLDVETDKKSNMQYIQSDESDMESEQLEFYSCISSLGDEELFEDTKELCAQDKLWDLKEAIMEKQAQFELSFTTDIKNIGGSPKETLIINPWARELLSDNEFSYIKRVLENWGRYKVNFET